MIWLGEEGTGKKEAGTAAAYVEESIEEGDSLIWITREMHMDAAIQFWAKKSTKGEIILVS